jgi:LDH2 family malate/lactate/ureidoglycolate dehydrogenase
VHDDFLLTPDDLIALAATILASAGTSPEHAGVVARSLVEANVAGHDSHGVLRLVSYVEFVERGEVQPSAEPALVFERGAIARVDGRRGWGQLAAQLATATAVRLARSHGVGVVVVDRCGHVGRVGEYVETIAAAGFVGHALCNADPAVAPPGTGVRALGTNPVAWAVPRGTGDPVLVDFATAELAEGKLRVALSRGEQLKVPAVVDAQGRPSYDPAAFYDGGALVPFGGHKGYALSVVAELIGRGLAAGAVDDGHDTPYSLFILALDPAATGTSEGFLAAVDAWCGDVRTRAEATGAKVTLPGEPEARARADRRANGVPVPPTIWNALLELRDRLDKATAAPAQAEAS